MSRRLLACLLGVSVAGLASAGIAEQAQRLAALRAEVDSLNDSLDQERDAMRADLAGLERERSEVEARIRQQETRLSETERLLQKQREQDATPEVVDATLTPVLSRTLEELGRRVESGLPFRTTDRLDAIATVQRDLQTGDLDPRKGAGRVWQLLEDELRLTRENALDRQVIVLDEEEVLVETARLGMIALYWRAPDGRVGRARSGDPWTFEVLPEADKPAVQDLFDAMSKQVRVGWFELPGLTDALETP